MIIFEELFFTGPDPTQPFWAGRHCPGWKTKTNNGETLHCSHATWTVERPGEDKEEEEEEEEADLRPSGAASGGGRCCGCGVLEIMFRTAELEFYSFLIFDLVNSVPILLFLLLLRSSVISIINWSWLECRTMIVGVCYVSAL